MFSIALFYALFLLFITGLVVLPVRAAKYAVRKTGKKVWGVVAYILCFSIPWIDVVFSFMLYYASLPFWPEATIYKTVVTDSMYVENSDCEIYDYPWKNYPVKEGDFLVSPDWYLGYARKGKRIELLIKKIINKDYKRYPAEPKLLSCLTYKSNMSDEYMDHFYCSPAQSPESDYLVTFSKFQFILTRYTSMTVSNRKTSEVIAKLRQIQVCDCNFFPFNYGFLLEKLMGPFMMACTNFYPNILGNEFLGKVLLTPEKTP